MADKFKMGMAGAFTGMGHAMAQVGKEKMEERGVAYDLYIKLSSNPKYRKKEGYEYVKGHTRVQVMQGFEEDPEYSWGGKDIPLNEDEVNWLKQIDPKKFGYLKPGMEISQSLVRFAFQKAGMESKEKITTDKLEQTWAKHLDDIRMELTKLNIKDTKAFDRMLKNPKYRFFIQELFKPLDMKIEDVKKSGILGNIFGVTEPTIKPTPTPTSTPTLTEESLTQDDIIQNSETTEEAYNKLIKNKHIPDIPAKKQQVIDRLMQINPNLSQEGQKLMTPGLTETGTMGIERDLGRPSPTGTAPSTFLPNASPYNRLKTLAYLRNIPRQM